MKNLYNHFIYHLRSYRSFHFLFFTFILCLTSVAIYQVNKSYAAQDLLEQAFQPALSNETIINLWLGKDAVGNEILKSSIINLKGDTQAPLIVRITKFLLRITMVLSVTMVIFNAIMWIIESAKWGDVKDAKKNITFIVIGILLALMSLGIINLISSITISSLTM